MNVKLLLENGAIAPTKAHSTDAGFDLYTPHGFIISAHDFKKIDLGVHIAIPEGYYGQIQGRSGLAAKDGIFPIGGVIDSGYTGEIAVTLINFGSLNKYFKAGERIAQLVFHEVPHIDWVQVDQLDKTERGSKGFGSSGK